MYCNGKVDLLKKNGKLLMLKTIMLLNIKDYGNTKTVHSCTYEREKLECAIWRNSPAFEMKEPIAYW